LHDLSVCIISWNVRDLTLDCLRSLPDAIGSVDAEVILADNASSDGTVEAVRAAFPEVRIIANVENLGFSRAANQAIREARGRYLLILNPDTLLDPGCLEAVVRFMDETPRAAVVCTAVYGPDGRPERYMAGRVRWFRRIPLGILRRFLPLLPAPNLRSRLMALYNNWYEASIDPADAVPRRVRSIEGPFYLVRRGAVQQVGLLDEDYFFGMELSEWSRRFRRSGWHLYLHPGARILHLGGRSAAQLGIRHDEPWVYRQYYHDWYTRGGLIGLRWHHARAMLSLRLRSLFLRWRRGSESAQMAQLMALHRQCYEEERAKALARP